MFHVAAAVFCAVIYNCWAGGLPWDFANGNANPTPQWAFYVGLPAWLATVWLVWSIAGRQQRAPAPG
jgi:hypothetical protein